VPREAADAAPCVDGETPDALLTVLAYAPGHLALEAITERPGFLVLSETAHPRWAARVDGQPAPLLRANYLAQAVPVPAGTHRVELRFEPGILLPALAGFTLAGVSAFLGVTAAGFIRLSRSLSQSDQEKR
jgi:hypothetical protein